METFGIMELKCAIESESFRETKCFRDHAAGGTSEFPVCPVCPVCPSGLVAANWPPCVPGSYAESREKAAVGADLPGRNLVDCCP